MGALTLTEVPEDKEAAGERISFNPCRLVPGIEASGHPILEGRMGGYEVSRQMRGGCPEVPDTATDFLRDQPALARAPPEVDPLDPRGGRPALPRYLNWTLSLPRTPTLRAARSRVTGFVPISGLPEGVPQITTENWGAAKPDTCFNIGLIYEGFARLRHAEFFARDVKRPRRYPTWRRSVPVRRNRTRGHRGLDATGVQTLHKRFLKKAFRWAQNANAHHLVSSF